MKNTQQTITIALSIFLGFVLIALAIFFSPKNTQLLQKNFKEEVAVDLTHPQRNEGTPKREYGNTDAAITIVEFSDYQCPFCSKVHPTIKRIVDESQGEIKWEYRHLPLSIHAQAVPAALAAECVADSIGNENFWKFSDILLANQRGLTSEFLKNEAVTLGVDSSFYDTCIVSEDVKERIRNDTKTAVAMGGNGTPFSVIEFADGSTKSVSGALPYENFMQIISNKN